MSPSSPSLEKLNGLKIQSKFTNRRGIILTKNLLFLASCSRSIDALVAAGDFGVVFFVGLGLEPDFPPEEWLLIELVDCKKELHQNYN